MGKFLKGTNPISADNLEDSLALVGINAYPSALLRAKFSDISSIDADIGYHLCSNTPMGSGATLSVGVDSLRTGAFFVPQTIHLDRLAFIVTTIGAAGSKARVGLYNSTLVGTRYIPSTLIVDGGEFDCTTLNGKITNVDVTLQGGQVYFCAYVCGTNAPTVSAFNASTSAIEPALGYRISSALATAIPVQGFQHTFPYAALPLVAPAVAGFSGNIPGVFYRLNG